MQKNSLKILPTIVVVTLLAGLCAPLGWSKRNTRDIDADARRDKAAALVDLSAAIEKHSDLASLIAADRARSLNPTDTSIMLWDNMLRLVTRVPDKKAYDEQLKLITENPSAPIEHYPTIIVLSKNYEPGDTLKPYLLSRLAHKRNPDNDYIGTYALKRGIEAASSYRFTSEGDTLAMTPRQVEFVRGLVGYADTLIMQYGRNPAIDMNKAQLYYIISDTVAMRALADKMYINDADDPATLNDLVNIFSAIDDTARVVELGMRSLELEPSPDPVQRMFSLASRPEDMERLRNTVMATAENTMLEPELRATILNAAVTGITEHEPLLMLKLYGTDISDFVPTDSARLPDPANDAFIVRVDSMAREMIAEEPDNYPMIRYMADFGKHSAWMHKYGIGYLLDYAFANPDKDEENYTSIQTIIENDVYPEGRDESINTVIDTLISHNPESSLFLVLNKANIAMRYDRHEDAHVLLDTMTYAGTIDMARRSMKTSTDTEIEEAAKEQWIKILTVKSDIESKLNRPDDAIATLRRIQVIKPDDPMVLNNLGYIMATNGGDLHESLDLIERSLELEPDNPNTIDSKAWIQYLMHDYEGALETMKHFFSVIKLPIEEINGTAPKKKAEPSETTEPTEPSEKPTETTESAEELAEESESIHDILDRYDINPEPLGPIITHLLAIYDALGMDNEATNTYRAAVELAPEDEIVVKFKNDHNL